MSELTIFARFHAREGREQAVAEILRAQTERVRREPGCIFIYAYRSVRDPRLFHFHSQWVDEAAFDVHAEIPQTLDFLARIEPLIDHSLDVTRSRLLA